MMHKKTLYLLLQSLLSTVWLLCSLFPSLPFYLYILFLDNMKLLFWPYVSRYYTRTSSNTTWHGAGSPPPCSCTSRILNFLSRLAQEALLGPIRPDIVKTRRGRFLTEKNSTRAENRRASPPQSGLGDREFEVPRRWFVWLCKNCRAHWHTRGFFVV